MSKRLQTGGSQGEPVRTGGMPFFYPEVKAVELITKNVYGLRLLPAFERDDANLPVSPTSIRPYRDAANVDPTTGKAAFTDWYYSLKGYKFLGNDGRGFLSPLIMEKTDHRGVDPLFDCYHLARNSKDSHPEWYGLTEKAEGEKNATLEKYRVFCAMNALLQVDNTPVNRLVLVTKASQDHMKEQLDVLCSRADQPNDPDWPDFMLGDVTSPYNGLWGTVQKGSFNKAGMEASLFSFSRSKDRLVNPVKYPVDPNSAWGQEVLAARWDIGDLERVTKVATAQEILDYIVNDGFLPIELIREACSPFWDIPAPQGRRTSAPRSYDESADAGGGGFARPRPAAAPLPTQAPAPAAAPTRPAAPAGRQFWIVLPNGQTSPQAMPESVLRTMVTQQRQDLTVMLVGTDAWSTASAFGITVPAPAPAVAPPPAPPAAPSAPPAPPAPPAAPRPPAAPPAATAAPRPPAPTAPRVVAPGGPPTPGGVPPLSPPRPPTPVQPPAPAHTPPPPPAAPAAAAAPAAPAPPAAPEPVATAVLPLTDAERAELTALEAEWLNVVPTGVQMDGARVARFCELSDRASAAVAQ